MTQQSLRAAVYLRISLDREMDGLAIDRLIDNHLTILFDGLSAPAGGKQWTSS